MEGKLPREIKDNIDSYISESIQVFTNVLNNQFESLADKLTKNLAEVIKAINENNSRELTKINNELQVIKEKQKDFELKHSLFSWFSERPIRIAYLAGIVSGLAIIIKYI